MPSVVEQNLEKAKEVKRESDKKDFELQLEKQLKERLAEQYVKERHQYIDGFLDSTVKAMRSKVAELCDSVLRSMGRANLKKKLSPSHKNKLRDMIKKVGYLNFYDDKEITKLLSELELEIDKFKDEDNPDVVAAKLEEIIKMATQELDVASINPAIGYLEP
jgi:hypothetical protein